MVSYLAIILGSWWNLLHWLSLTFFAMSVGYAGFGARVFGKQSDGRLPVWSKIVHFPYLAFSQCVWQIARLLSRENPVDKVSDDLILGRRLYARELPAGISNYVDLTAEAEDPESIRKTEMYFTLPILDASVPSSDALHLAITRLKPGPTFVHCAQGHGRTGLFALALLAEHHQIQSFDDGMAIIKTVRPGVGLNKTQESFIKTYIAEIARKK